MPAPLYGCMSAECDFQVGVGVAPQQGYAGEPVFCLDQLACLGELFGRQNSGRGREFGAGDFAADRTGRDFDLRIVANAFVFAELGVGHEVELAVILREPDGCVYRDAGFAEGCQADITLAVDFGGNGGIHSDILNGL
jgi:hypothetical protein